MKTLNRYSTQDPLILVNFRAKVLLVAFVTLFCMTGEAAKGGGKPGGGESSPPEITSISPTSGSIDGGTSVTINGQNFSKQATVTFGGLTAASLDVRRDRAVFRLAAEKLAEAEGEYRQLRAEQIIRSSTRKAVVGALAAVSPGSDVIIQGYIGTSMTRELCKLFGAAPRDLDIEEFLNLSQSRAGKALPLSLAVAGNGLKAFPGLGTVAGGLVHAVAYGLIFDALGRSLVLTLTKNGELDPAGAAQAFEEGISEHIEAGVRQVAKMALDQGDKKD